MFGPPVVHTLHHLPAHQVVQQLQGVFLHPDREVCSTRAGGGSGRRERSDCGERITTVQSTQHALQQSQRLPGKANKRKVNITSLNVYVSTIIFEHLILELLLKSFDPVLHIKGQFTACYSFKMDFICLELKSICSPYTGNTINTTRYLSKRLYTEQRKVQIILLYIFFQKAIAIAVIAVKCVGNLHTLLQD